MCDHEFSLTWTRYFKTPFGRMDCPSCRKKLVVTHRWFYWPLMLIGVCILGIPLAVCGSKFGIGGTSVGWFIGGFSGGIPFDRFLEERFSVLKPRPDEVSKEAIDSDD